MPTDEQNSRSSADRERTAWFRRNRNGFGWHPSAWQGWLIMVAIVAVIVVVVVLFRTGVL
jgi:hypothetical protein